MSFTKYLVIFEYSLDGYSWTTTKEERFFPELLIFKDKSKRDRHFQNWMRNLMLEGCDRWNVSCALRLVEPREYNVTECSIRLPKGGIGHRHIKPWER